MPRKLDSHRTGSAHGSRPASSASSCSSQRGELGVETVQVGEHVLERALCVGVLQALAVHPRSVLFGPGSLTLAEDPAVPEQLLGDAMARRGARATQVVGAADQVAQALLRGRRRRDEAQLAGAVEPDQLLRVAAVGLDAITGTHRDQRRRDHIARHAEPAEQPQQVIAARAGLVADRQSLGAAEAIDQPADRALGVLDPPDLRRPAGRRQRRDDNRVLVHIQRDPQTHIRGRGRANVRHGLVLLRMRHWPKRLLTRATLTRDRCERRGPARNLGVHPD
jgi:hypothetical protein